MKKMGKMHEKKESRKEMMMEYGKKKGAKKYSSMKVLEKSIFWMLA